MNTFGKIRFFTILLCLQFCIPTAFAQTAKLEASKAENIGGSRPNSQGVYPVQLRWQASGTSANFQVYRSESADSGFEKTSAEQSIKNESGAFIFIDENPSAVAGKLYYYRVMTVNSAGNAAIFSETAMGYGALSAERFFIEYSKTVDASIKKLTLMHKSGALSKLGSEEIKGSVSGSLSYNAKREGLGGRVIMQFTQYADLYSGNNRDLGFYFLLNGNMNTTANMAQNGKMDGTVTVTGMYRGKVHYDKIQIKSALPGGGTYTVEVDGFPAAELSWATGTK